jgi:hypothetical protein
MQKVQNDDFWNFSGCFNYRPNPYLFLLSSPTAELICQKSKLTVKELLEPFASMQINSILLLLFTYFL